MGKMNMMDKKILEQIKELINGQTVKDISLFDEYDRVAIESITFENGTVIELFGQSDNAYFESIKKENGEDIPVTDGSY